MRKQLAVVVLILLALAFKFVSAEEFKGMFKTAESGVEQTLEKYRIADAIQ